MAGLDQCTIGALHLLHRGFLIQSQYLIGFPQAIGIGGLVTFLLPGVLRTIPLLFHGFETVLQGEEVPLLDTEVISDAEETILLHHIHHLLARIGAFEEVRQECQATIVIHAFVLQDGQASVDVILASRHTVLRPVLIERVNQFRESSRIVIILVLRLRKVFHGALQSVLLAFGVTPQGDHIRIEP